MDQIHEETIMFIGVLALAGWVLWLLFRRYQMNTQIRLQRTEAFNKLIEKFSSATELAEFLGTDQGKKFLEDPMPQQTHPKKIVLRFVQMGIVLVAVAAGFMIKWHQIQEFIESQSNPDMNWINESMDYLYWTMFSAALSVAMFVLAIVTHFFTRSWRIDSTTQSKS
jgi:NADH:ubiquinone oxidoreductase subunit 5 (subunit L)/multisubunit Na+/H+ antiporter MnhA subunit